MTAAAQQFKLTHYRILTIGQALTPRSPVSCTNPQLSTRTAPSALHAEGNCYSAASSCLPRRWHVGNSIVLKRVCAATVEDGGD